MNRKYLEKYLDEFTHLDLFYKFIIMYDKMAFDYGVDMCSDTIDSLIYMINESEIVDYDSSCKSKEKIKLYNNNIINFLKNYNLLIPKTIFNEIYQLTGLHPVTQRILTLIKYIYIAGDYHLYSPKTIANHIINIEKIGKYYFKDRKLSPLDKLIVRAVKYSCRNIYTISNFSDSINYELCDKLGCGISGTTYLARVNKETDVVIKKFNLTKSNIGYIVRELSVLKYLEHENIINMLDYTADNTEITLMTEYGGQILDDYIKQKSVKCFQKYDLIHQLVLGINFIHKSGYIHGDLKSNNIVVKDGILKIIDFGFCITNISNNQYLNKCNITAVSMSSPEIYFGLNWSIYYDIWTIGILIYIIIYGTREFNGFSDLQDIVNFVGYPEDNLPYNIYSCNLNKSETKTLDKIKPALLKNLLISIMQYHPEKRMSTYQILEIIESLKISAKYT